MRFRFPILTFAAFLLLGPSCFGMAAGGGLTIRLHAVGSELDSPSFVGKIMAGDPPKTVYIKKVPEISERDIAAVWPTFAADGTRGCVLLLNAHGARELQVASLQLQGRVLLVLVNKRVVTAMRVDQQITDGRVWIHAGLTPKELKAILKRYPVMGGKP